MRPAGPRLHSLNLGSALLALSLIVQTGCHVGQHRTKTPVKVQPQRDINAVLRDHDKELLAIPGVVGVFVGLLADNKTPCLKVLAEKITPEVRRRVPAQIDGYPVVVEESGPIRPLDSK
jgi:hypothetical protein